MSLLSEFPNFEDLPQSQSTQIRWLGQAVGALKREIGVLKGRAAASQTEGQEASGKGPQADSVKTLDLNQYPVMAKFGKVGKLTEHFRAIGGEPSAEACQEKLRFFESGPKNNASFAKHFKLSKAEAIAWTYILKKRGWIIWSENPKGLILTQNRPLPVKRTLDTD
jgi:hypothetical protein